MQGHLVKWVIMLIPFAIKYAPLREIKGQRIKDDIIITCPKRKIRIFRWQLDHKFSNNQVKYGVMIIRLRILESMVFKYNHFRMLGDS